MNGQNRSLLEFVGLLLAIITPVAGGVWYASGLQNELENAKREIVELRTRLEAVQQSSASGFRGQKGDKGDPGDPGPRGLQGPPGETLSEEEVGRIIARYLANNPPTKAIPKTASVVDDASAKPDADCVDVGTLETSSFQLKNGDKVCDQNGKLLATVKVTADGYPDYIGVAFTMPGSGRSFCWQEAKACSISFLPESKYYIESLTPMRDGSIALLRRK